MIKIGVFFGGKSGEHDVSLVSGHTVLSNLDKKKYQVFALGIRRDGVLASAEGTAAMLGTSISGVTSAQGRIISPGDSRMVDIVAIDSKGEESDLDVFFPVLHGTYGEDGTIQGLLELSEKPFVGCGTMTSAVAMDKPTAKQVFRDQRLPVLPWLTIFKKDWQERAPVWMGKILKEIGMPCYVKPARLGSSVGISKANRKEDVAEALERAFQYDYKVIVEQGIPAREIECSVMGNQQVSASRPGEVVPEREFYDYVAKYVSDDSKLIFPADIDSDQEAQARDLACRAFNAVGAEGYARVDFLMDQRDGSLYLSEINTIPGFTEISMFPKLWTLDNIQIPQLLDQLIDLGLERHRFQTGRKTTFQVPQ